ncbi:hypothetical protein A4A49_55056 [Nicotiana attenuata]|uniref:Uncharacterized protein n=1 Tax=Nicotiana attenuata TaxID=49451 RepID=A0A1J6K3N0_NICAT|nr:hypothetical protein A4A49_55056 [Nicotiana attenuata]
MASACISTNCVNEIARAPVRPTYVNLYKWPESDAEFIKSVVSSRINNQYNGNIECSHPNNPTTVLDSISYRQLYLRSYPFSKEENVRVDDEKSKMARAPVRATYVNQYKWPESDIEFIKSISSKINQNSNIGCNHPEPNEPDSISYRQLYLRSYPFSKEESVCEKIVLKYYRIKRKVRNTGDNSSGAPSRNTRENMNGIRKAKEISCAALFSIFRRLLSCTVKVDVVD